MTRFKTLMAILTMCCLPAAAAARGTKLPGDGVPESIRYYETVAMMSPSEVASEPSAGGAGVKTADISFYTLGRQFDLKLEEHDPFAPGAIVHWVDDTGEVAEPLQGNGQFFSGRVEGDPHSWVRIAMRGSALAGVVATDDELYFLEPASRFFGEEVASETLAYRLSDTDSEWEPGSCGAVDPPTHHHPHVAGSASGVHLAMRDVLGQAITAAATGTLKRAQVGIVADYLYFGRHGATATSDIAELVNDVDGIYQSEVGVTIQIMSTVVFTTQGSDPFFNTGVDANTLLTAFSGWKSANDNNSSQVMWNTDIAHLLTGRDINGPCTSGCANNCCVIGLSYIGTLCDSTYGVGIDQDFTTAVNLMTLLLAHEMGHNFGAYHDAQVNSACPCCTASPATFIMNPVLSSSLQSKFSDCTKSFINPEINAASCFDTVDVTPPPTPTNTPVPADAGAFVAQTVPAAMTAGQPYSVSVTMQNTGAAPWTAAGAYRLGAVNPYDNTTWGMNRVGLASGESVAPGQQKTFTWTATAPATAGTYNFQWRMVQDGVAWFGATSTNAAVTVTAANSPNATYVTQSVPSSMTAGKPFSVSVTMKNSGATTWTAASAYRLGAVNPYDNTSWGMNRVGLASGESIAPGQQKTFSWTVTAPATAGTYNFQWRMLQDGVTWFGDTSTNVAVTVVAASSPNATYVTQSVPNSMTAGQPYSVSVTMKNSGGTTWTAASAYRLGAVNPYDNTSWGMNRVGLASGESIAPGQQKTFSWTVTAPATAGTYNFQWRMLQDGVAWFGDTSTNVAVTVAAASAPNASYVTQSVPTTVSVGQQYSVSVTVQNTGGTTWTAASFYRLGAVNPYDNTSWGMNRVGLASGESIAPGQQKTFSWTMTAPAAAGTYNFQWRMVQEGVAWFGATSTNVPVVVQ